MVKQHNSVTTYIGYILRKHSVTVVSAIVALVLVQWLRNC